MPSDSAMTLASPHPALDLGRRLGYNQIEVKSMEEPWDNPFDNPMYCGPMAELKAYMAACDEDEDECIVILSDPTGLCYGGSPRPLLEAVFEADRRRVSRRARRLREAPEQG